MKFAILVMCKDRPKMLEQSLTSILDKTLHADIYLLDNGSEDSKAIELINGFSKRDRVTLVRSGTNLFCAPGRGYLLSQFDPEQYDVIVSIDDDVVVTSENPIETILTPIFEDEAVGAVTGLLIDQKTNEINFGEATLSKQVNPEAAIHVSQAGPVKVPKKIVNTVIKTEYVRGGFSAFRASLLRFLWHNYPDFPAGKGDYDHTLRLRVLGSKILYCTEWRGIHLKTFQESRKARQDSGVEEKTWRTAANLLESTLVFKALWGFVTVPDYSMAIEYRKVMAETDLTWEELQKVGLPDEDDIAGLL